MNITPLSNNAPRGTNVVVVLPPIGQPSLYAAISIALTTEPINFAKIYPIERIHKIGVASMLLRANTDVRIAQDIEQYIIEYCCSSVPSYRFYP